MAEVRETVKEHCMGIIALQKLVYFPNNIQVVIPNTAQS